MVYIFSNYWAFYIFVFGFFIYPLGGAAGGSRGGIINTYLGVKAAIRALGLRLVGHRGRFIAGTG